MKWDILLHVPHYFFLIFFCRKKTVITNTRLQVLVQDRFLQSWVYLKWQQMEDSLQERFFTPGNIWGEGYVAPFLTPCTGILH